MRYMLLLILVFAHCYASAQVDAGEDIIISAGIPVRLQGLYEGHFGKPVTAGDDYFVGPFEIGFEFVYFGNTYTEFAISPNGLLSFHVPDIIGLSNWKPSVIPNSLYPATIMGPYQDLFSRPIEPHNRYIYYETVGNAPDRRLIVGWCEAPMFGCPDQQATFQIVLFESDHSIANHLIYKPACYNNYDNKATHGLNYNKNIGVIVPGRNWESFTADSESWRFTPKGSDNYEIEQVTFMPECIIPKNSLEWKWYEGSYPGGKQIGSESSIIVSPLQTTDYFAEITLCGGVTYHDMVTIQVIPVPNAFRPESQIKSNTIFRVYTHPPEYQAGYVMYIYDRWGKEVFETSAPDEGWDGTHQGKACPAGVYVWVILLKDETNRNVTQKGYVTLIR